MASKPVVAAHHWSFYDHEVSEACDHALALGYAGIDLAIGDMGSGPRLQLAVLANSRAETERIGAIGEEKGITFTDFVAAVIHVPGVSRDDRSRAFDSFERFTEHASSMGITGMTVLPGFFDTEHEEAFEMVAGELRRYVAAAGANGLRFSIEPHLDSVTDTPERTLRMLEEVPGLSLTLDYSHFVYSGFGHNDLEPLDKYARHVHARQATTGHLSAPVDHGSIDYRRFLTHLRSVGYEGALTTEFVESEWYNQNEVDSKVENARMREVLVETLEEVWL